MCNEAARRAALGLIREDFSQVRITLTFPEGAPNLAASDSIRITDPAAIVRFHAGAHELVQRRWSWSGAFSGQGAGKPVYNFRSEGRAFGNSATQGRCLIPLDGFYEFTDAGHPLSLAADLAANGAAPAPPRGKARKDRWLFTMPGAADGERALFCVAGLWRSGVEIGSRGVVETGARATGPATGEAFTMLTCEPGADIAPYHSRQIVIMPRERWADWLGGVVPARDLIAPTPAGTLVATRVR